MEAGGLKRKPLADGSQFTISNDPMGEDLMKLNIEPEVKAFAAN